MTAIFKKSAFGIAVLAVAGAVSAQGTTFGSAPAPGVPSTGQAAEQRGVNQQSGASSMQTNNVGGTNRSATTAPTGQAASGLGPAGAGTGSTASTGTRSGTAGGSTTMGSSGTGTTGSTAASPSSGSATATAPSSGSAAASSGSTGGSSMGSGSTASSTDMGSSSRGGSQRVARADRN